MKSGKYESVLVFQKKKRKKGRKENFRFNTKFLKIEVEEERSE